ncbi:MAG TPA: SGNH/GDSL hydrolase family protein [Sporichthyaceae bacterium]|jgi:lysophospholipase L1-like esterase
MWRSRWRAALGTGALVLSTAVPAGAATGTDATAWPTSMAAVGDSISRAFDACGFFRDCPPRSWSTGTDSRVDSLRTRLAAASGHDVAAVNLAHTGVGVAALSDQIAQAVPAKVDYVTIDIGANDACADSVPDMTSVPTFRTQLRAALGDLRRDLPQARVQIISIPDVNRLWEIAHTHRLARFTWTKAHICQSLLADPLSTSAADEARRATVGRQVDSYNAELAAACADYGPTCRWDGGVVHGTRFTFHQLSKWDYFHPNVYGQRALAEVAWRAGFFS